MKKYYTLVEPIFPQNLNYIRLYNYFNERNIKFTRDIEYRASLYRYGFDNDWWNPGLFDKSSLMVYTYIIYVEEHELSAIMITLDTHIIKNTGVYNICNYFIRLLEKFSKHEENIVS